MKARALRGALGLVIVGFLFSGLSAATITWDPFTTYTIPDDNNTYTLGSDYTLTADMTINGTFEMIGPNDLTCDHEIVVNDGGDCRVKGEDVLFGIGGNDVILGGNGELVVKNGGLVQIKGGDAYQFDSTSGGDVDININVLTENGGILLVNGGDGGLNGGMGGAVKITKDFTLEGGGSFSLNGGSASAGQEGGRIEVDVANITVNNKTCYIRGGNAGNWTGEGGRIEIDGTISIEKDGELILIAGDGGYRNSSDEGGRIEIDGIIDIEKEGRLSIISGDGGDSIAEDVFPGGRLNILASVYLDGTLSITSGDGGDGGSSNYGGNGGAVYFKYPIKMLPNGLMFAKYGTDGSNPNRGVAGLIYGQNSTLPLVVLGWEPLEYCDSIITLTNTLELNETWTICACDQKVYGNGNKIVLGASGEIVVPANCAVLFDNLEIEGVSDTNIRCLEDTSTLSFDNVVLDLDTSYAFTEGNLYFAGNCTVEGGGFTFGFESDGVMNIQPNSKLTFSPNTIFEYDTTPASLLVMAASSSILSLDNAKLLATQPLTLLTGILDIEGFGIVEGVGTLSLGGLRGMMIQGGLARVGDVTLS